MYILRKGGGVDVCIEVAMGTDAGCPVVCNDVVRSDAVEWGWEVGRMGGWV